MGYNLLITLEAREEALDAFMWYENKLSGLGDELLVEVEQCYLKLTTNPLAYGFLSDSVVVRYMLLSRFPYVIIYVIKDNTVTIVSVRHTSRQQYL